MTTESSSACLPPDPSSADLTPWQAQVNQWIAAFRVQRVAIERGIRENQPLDVRSDALIAANRALPDEAFDDVVELEAIADRLEGKLKEMARAILHAEVKLPGALSDVQEKCDLTLLQNDVCRDERRWLFVGGMVEILFQYRDRGQALVLGKRDQLLKRLAASADGISRIIRRLDGYLVIEQAIDVEQREEISRMLDSVGRVHAIYDHALRTGGDAGIEAVLEDNYEKLKGQFLLACAQLSLQLYGNVSIALLEDLHTLKSFHIFIAPGVGPEWTNSADADRKYFERSMKRALARVYEQARKESWPTWPIVELYQYNLRFGRKAPRAHQKKR